ncbi:T-complex protein 1 subunit eta [Entomophthora muscae]|uniref:T-complex protein 1 subunit eta n=1 Tax=Entomophthora muscae TaxID=34485 RepID=A0ACC2RER7_9FUNG|nr:T-complex protein 1 subunit eta [Entomophthora muscae]
MGYPGRKYRQETGRPLPSQGYGQPSVPVPPQGPFGEHMSVPLGSHPSYNQPPNHNQHYIQPYGQPIINQNHHMPGSWQMPGTMPNPGGMPMPGNIPGGMPMPNPGMPLPDSKTPMPDSGFPMLNGYPHENTNFNAPPPPPYPGQPQFDPQASYPPPQNRYEYGQPQNQYAYNQPPSFQPIPSSQPVPSGMGSAVAVSNFSGRKKAVLIGINYFGTNAELRGCINDVNNVTDFISRNYGFSTDNIVILTDDQKNDSSRMPTRANILQAMQWLVADARPNDSLFFHFSGHGSQREDKDGDEDDGFDETICPVDYDQSGRLSMTK